MKGIGIVIAGHLSKDILRWRQESSDGLSWSIGLDTTLEAVQLIRQFGKEVLGDVQKIEIYDTGVLSLVVRSDIEFLARTFPQALILIRLKKDFFQFEEVGNFPNIKTDRGDGKDGFLIVK